MLVDIYQLQMPIKTNVLNVKMANTKMNIAKKIVKNVKKAHGVTPKVQMTNRTANIAMPEPIHPPKVLKL